MKKLFLYFVFCLLPFAFGDALAQFVIPALPTTPIYDEVGFLSAEEKTTIENQILTLEAETHHQIGIAIIKSLQDRPDEEAGLAILRGWGIGQSGLDNGLLFLIAPTERKIRIEVGRGLEGVMTDLMSQRVIDENLTPNFKQSNYAEGITEALERITPILKGEVVELPEKRFSFEDMQGLFILCAVFGWFLLSILSASKSWWLGGVVGAIVGLIIFGTLGALGIGIFGLILDFFLSKFAYKKIPLLRNMGGSRWGGGGFGGGSSGGGWGGFGGGSGGGGGASGGW